VIVAACAAAAVLFAHEMTIKGTVAAFEPARLQVRTGLEPRGREPAWYPIGAATVVRRGAAELSLDQAEIQVGERVVLIVDHPDKGPMLTKEIRLAER
jgi:hypothetical protein